MLRKVLLVVIIFCVTQELNGRPQGNPVQEAIEKINPELDKISARLKNLKLEIHKSLLKSLVDQHGAIAKSGEALLEAINDLESNTTEIAMIANETNINIEACLKTQQGKLERILTIVGENTAKVSEQNLLRASNFSETTNDIIKKAEDIDKNINKIIGYCIRQNSLAWQKEKLIECLYREVDYLDHKIVDDLYKQKNELENDQNHIAKNQNSFLGLISSLQTEFLECVSQSETHTENSTEMQKSTESSSLLFDITETTDQDASSAINIQNQKLNITDKFENPQTIFERIQKLQFLLDQLKQVRQQHGSEREQFSKRNQFQSSRPYGYKPNRTNFRKNESQQASEENRPYILYISL